MMERNVRILVETDATTLKYHPDSRIVHHEIRRFVRGEEIRQLLEKGLEVVTKHRATKWLSDDRGNGPLTPADAEWARADWAPRMIEAGWRHWAIVMPEKVVGQMNMRRWAEFYTERGVTVEAFTDPDEALRWLERQG